MGVENQERRGARRPTMREVAAVAGVSLSTVSRVVNGGEGVRADLAVRVRDAVELLGYRHNLTASALRRADGSSASIGLIVEDVSNPFFGAVHRGVEDVARARGMLTLVGSSDEEPERERELAEAFGQRGVDGLILATSVADSSYLLRERAAGVALVFVDRPPRFFDADTVVTDNAGGARAAVEHLLEAGHRRIGFLGDRPDVHTAAERLRGYRETLARHGLEEELDLVRHPQFRGVDAYETTCELLRGNDPPTALFTSQNLITIGAVRALHSLGLARAGGAGRLRRHRARRRGLARAHRGRPGPGRAGTGGGGAAVRAARRLRRAEPARRAADAADRARVGRAGAGLTGSPHGRCNRLSTALCFADGRPPQHRSDARRRGG